MTTIICTAVVLSAVLLYLFLIFPSRKSKLSAEFTTCPIAHRGVHSENCPENSLSAFEGALRAGLPSEFDVRLTRDKVPVVFHDKDLKRMCGFDVNVATVTYEELRKYPLSGSGECIPTLSQVLSAVEGKVPLLIELKGEDRSDIALRVADVIRDYKGTLAVESFNPYHLMRMRRLMPNVPLGLLSGRRIGKTPFTVLFGYVAMHMLTNFLFRPDFIAFRYTDRLPLGVRICRKISTPIIGWTCGGEAAYSENRRNFDGLICDGLGKR